MLYNYLALWRYYKKVHVIKVDKKLMNRDRQSRFPDPTLNAIWERKTMEKDIEGIIGINLILGFNQRVNASESLTN